MPQPSPLAAAALETFEVLAMEAESNDTDILQADLGQYTRTLEQE